MFGCISGGWLYGRRFEVASGSHRGPGIRRAWKLATSCDTKRSGGWHGGCDSFLIGGRVNLGRQKFFAEVNGVVFLKSVFF